ncbi:MAG: hypothetical protein JWQ33_2345 [Ramlibacter sp.]|nr:hypothetical protein [Ramlibacter sp.]
MTSYVINKYLFLGFNYKPNDTNDYIQSQIKQSA